MTDKSDDKDLDKVKDGTDQKGAPPQPVPPNEHARGEAVRGFGTKLPEKEDTSKDALGEGKGAKGEKFQIGDQSAAIKKEPELVAPDPATAKLDEADATQKLRKEYLDDPGGTRITPREDTAQRHLPNLMIVDEGSGGPPGGGPPGGGPPPPPPRRPPPDDPGQGPAPVPARPGPSSPEMGAQAKEPPPRSELQPAVSPPNDPSAARSK